MRLHRRGRFFLFAPLAILLFITIGGAVVLGLWNWLVPPLFSGPQITFWQALGLLALCRILFGGLGRHGGGPSRFRRRMGERWAQMTPEERERFREGLRGRCGGGPSASEGSGH